MNCPVYTALSPIHGRGLFANQYFPYGTILFKASDLKGTVTNYGRWVNHSLHPNVILHAEQDGYYVVTIMPIFQGQEIVANYRHTPECLEKSPS